MEIGGDGKVELLIRARAIAALAYFPTSVGRKFLEETIAGKRAATEPGDRLLLRKAAVALGWMGGLGVPEKLGPLLDHGDPDVRLDAAIGLGLTRLKSAADLMRKRFDIEPSPRVRSQIARQLRVIDEVAAAKR